MSSPVADIFRRATELNANDTRRQGNVVSLEAPCDVVVTGDIHGNRNAFAKVCSYFSRPIKRPRRLILQELIHGPLDEQTGHDRSIELLLRAARMKLADPAGVIFLLGNHDVAQVSGGEIAKDGCNVCQAFAEGVRFAFGDEEGVEILQAVEGFIVSIPLAARCANGVFLSHSLPSPSRMKAAGTEILARPYAREDFLRGGAVYEWTWGRGQKDEQLEALAAELGVSFFVLGHRHTPSGCEAIACKAITLASDHSHGCLLEFAADEPLDARMAMLSATPLASIE